MGSSPAVASSSTSSLGLWLRATAMARAPKETWLRPSPIMEYRFSTRGTPSSAAQRLTSVPAIRARCIKG